MSNKVDLFDLDEIAQEDRAVKIGGEEYPVEESSVGEYINLIREEREAAKANDEEKLGEDDFFERMIDSVKRSIPTCPEEKLKGLKPKQLFALLSWLTQANSNQEEDGEQPEKS